MENAPIVAPIGPNVGPVLSFIDLTTLAIWVLYLVVALATIYTLIAAYHWLRYGHNSTVTIPALSIHIAVSLGLIGFTLTGLP